MTDFVRLMNDEYNPMHVMVVTNQFDPANDWDDTAASEQGNLPGDDD